MINDDLNLKIWNNEKAGYWLTFRPPWRPSFQDIENYQCGTEFIRAPKNILILGATPELRELASRQKARIWVADYSANMIRMMVKLFKTPNIPKENLIINDWRRIDFKKKHKFSLVFGDLILRLLSPSAQKKLLKNLCLSLEDGGVFITRVHFVNQALAKKSIRNIIGGTLSQRGKNSDKYYFSGLLVSRLLDKLSLSSCKGTREKAIRTIAEYRRETKSILEKSILRIALERLNPPGARFYSQSKVELENILRTYFFINKKFVARDYDDADFFPIYQLKPKKH